MREKIKYIIIADEDTAKKIRQMFPDLKVYAITNELEILDNGELQDFFNGGYYTTTT